MSFHPTVIACGRFNPDTAAVLRKSGHHDGDDPADGTPFMVAISDLSVSQLARPLADLIGIRENDPAASLAAPNRILEKFDEISALLEDHDPRLVAEMRNLAEAGASFALIE